MLDKINRVVKYMVLSDLLLFVGWGFISPIFSIFILEKIEGATLVTVGIASAVYWVARAVVQPFVAKILDKRKGEKDDYFTLIGSLICAGLAALGIALVKTDTVLYAVQVFHGAAFGVYSVAWPAIFTRHMDKKGVAFDWSLDSGGIGLSVAVASIVGAKLAEALGFEIVFVLAGIGSITSALVLLAIPRLILPRTVGDRSGVHEARVRHKHKSRNAIGA
ncbi:hypothetical protein A3A64_04310 [Candidatus Gottesmanbacteria bacterium RIFCSPLOWO2_01_FULL_48_11]|uniref:Major facilitator superfamily (MFS) profile domain-containing protein n=3 Tax=Patescibacteria group TaxID=1783273 RepID=A0A1F6ATL8_9BACT|nr:MAG: hypothetical protein UX29_C0006G0019 [Parcubacteria group bacterium GW2011_GWA2_46_10]KKU22303.1 MAG: hypothetical protein UX31_C0004G0032 [Candidatus Nomurabacteria bacterium GW2011_GWA1_46_11]OGG28010.1 MAG: hypothetical protein A3A64_04310 [Candidatus Gottesmanbacteria bacterium RIFCSPLOWO2_01_FULL_48_11]OGY56282.1 MAG: hypothetical protein A2119_00575 [Candidatus Colwellbacteria bacterium GWA2_46_10]